MEVVGAASAATDRTPGWAVATKVAPTAGLLNGAGKEQLRPQARRCARPMPVPRPLAVPQPVPSPRLPLSSSPPSLFYRRSKIAAIP